MEGKWVKKPSSGKSVVFVHGILSSGETCWKNANGTYWPELLAQSNDIKDVGVYVFTYRTNIFSGTYRVGDAVDAFKECMRLDGLFDCQSLIFVAHSMGGIVVRKLLVERARDFSSKSISIGLFLLASPSLGSQYAELLQPIATFFRHSQADVLRFSQSNAWLADLDKEFLNLKESGSLPLFGKELVEDVFVVLKGLIKKQVVEPFSGARYFGEPIKIANSDHFSIAKPGSESALQNRLLIDFVNGSSRKFHSSESSQGLHKAQLDRYWSTVSDFRSNYRGIMKALVGIQGNLDDDHTKFYQDLVSFYAESCRIFFEDNISILSISKLQDLKRDLDTAIESFIENGYEKNTGQPERGEVTAALGKKILVFAEAIHIETQNFERKLSKRD